MNNLDVLAIQEFRRFANTHIYPTTTYMIMEEICNKCDGQLVQFEPLPQPLIKFVSGIEFDENISKYTELLHTILKRIFIDFYNNPEIIKFIRNKIYTEIENEETKKLLNIALMEIQIGNPRYLGLLFNVTILKNCNTYVYL